MACRVFREPGRVARARGGPFGNTGRRTGGARKCGQAVPAMSSITRFAGLRNAKSHSSDDIERASDLVNAAERAASFEGQGDSTARSERLSIVEVFGSAFRQGAARADHAVWQRQSGLLP